MSEEPSSFWSGRAVMITGICGTVGSELLRQLSAANCSRIVGIDNNESELFFLDQTYGRSPGITLCLGDLRDREALRRRMRGVDVVLHTAALKHVILCEESPRDAVQTNVDGMINVIDAAEANGVQRVLFTSSDKAVNPTNVMGTTKLMAERLITAANAHRHDADGTVFASTRFGNVLGSRGSVVPLFKRQIAEGGPVTLTEPTMTRFIMTLEQAVALVIRSAELARGGEVFVTKMPVCRISDLATVMIEELAPRHGFRPEDVPVAVVGAKPGEKFYEELMNEEEVRRTLELDDFFCVLPAFKNIYQEIDYSYEGYVGREVTKPYNSAIEPAMTREDLREYLRRNRIV